MEPIAEAGSPSFEILYSPDPWDNLASMAVYIDRFAEGLGLSSLTVDADKLQTIGNLLVHPDFPHKDGLAKASPFKKAANFFVWFVSNRPITEKLPTELIGEDLVGIDNHQNAIFAYHLCVDCLHNATLYCRNEETGGKEPRVLSERIKVSYHFFRDFIEAYSCCTHYGDFKQLSLLFEQLAYKANPVGYDEVI